MLVSVQNTEDLSVSGRNICTTEPLGNDSGNIRVGVGGQIVRYRHETGTILNRVNDTLKLRRGNLLSDSAVFVEVDESLSIGLFLIRPSALIGGHVFDGNIVEERIDDLRPTIDLSLNIFRDGIAAVGVDGLLQILIDDLSHNRADFLSENDVAGQLLSGLTDLIGILRSAGHALSFFRFIDTLFGFKLSLESVDGVHKLISLSDVLVFTVHIGLSLFGLSLNLSQDFTHFLIHNDIPPQIFSVA